MYDRVINNQGNVTSTDGITYFFGAACLKPKLGINLRFLEFFFLFYFVFLFLFIHYSLLVMGFLFWSVCVCVCVCVCPRRMVVRED